MKYLMIPLALVLGSVAACSDSGTDTGQDAPETVAAQADEGRQVEACRAAVQELGGALKTALVEAMGQGGVEGALGVCHDEAQHIADRICDEDGLTVGRTSDRVRNPGNAPDSWEKAGLAAFADRIAAGEKIKDLEMWATVTAPDGARTFRYLKAIPTAPLCLNCHGADLSDDVAAKLADLYPDDQARGFALGDLRGAFSVKLDLPTPPADDS